MASITVPPHDLKEPRSEDRNGPQKRKQKVPLSVAVCEMLNHQAPDSEGQLSPDDLPDHLEPLTTSH